MHEYFTVLQLAEYLQIDAQTIRKHIRNGKLRAIKMGEGKRGEYRVARTDVEQYIRSMETKPVEV